MNTMNVNVASQGELDLVASMQAEEEVARQLKRHAELLPIASYGESGRFVLARLRQYPVHTFFMFLTTAAAAGALALLPWFIGLAVDVASNGRPMSELVRIAVLMMLTGIVLAVLNSTSRWLISALGQKVLARMREDVIDRALDLPAQTMERAGIGDALSRVADDVDETAKAVNNIVPYFVPLVFQMVTTIVAIILVSPWMLLMIVVIGPFYWFAAKWYLPRTNRIYRVERIARGARAQGLLAAINGIPTVHAYGIENREVRHVGSLSAAAARLFLRIISLVTRVVWIMQVPEALAIALLIGIGYVLVQAGAMPVGLVATVSIYVITLFWPFMSLVFSLDDLQSAGASLTRMVGVITSIDPATSQGTEVPRDGTVSLSGVSHSYSEGGRLAVQPIDLEIAEGETVALVGASGAGKSTLASILAGTLQPRTGTVRHGGANLAHADMEAVRGHASIVSQDVHVFHGTLAEDLRLANPDATDAQLWEALAVVGAEEWVRLLGKELETQVGEKGARLTAEQGQQVALARIVLQDPAILVMDEATADEGSSGARTLERAALAVAKGRTTIIVAHRLSQAMHADRILVMEDGHVVESGPHEALVERGGVYARLWSAWAQ